MHAESWRRMLVPGEWRRERNWDPTFSEFVSANSPRERNWDPTFAREMV